MEGTDFEGLSARRKGRELEEGSEVWVRGSRVPDGQCTQIGWAARHGF